MVMDEKMWQPACWESNIKLEKLEQHLTKVADGLDNNINSYLQKFVG